MKVIRLIASLIFVATVIVVVSALAHTSGKHTARATSDTSSRADSLLSSRTIVLPAKPPAAKAQRSLAPPAEPSAMPVDTAYAAHASGHGAGVSADAGLSAASRYAPGPTETLVFGIMLLAGGGFLRRRRRTGAD
jgi:hypothetical protein